MKTSVVLREYGVISEGLNGKPFTNGVEIDSDAFGNLVKYIDENSGSISFRNAFRIFRQNRRNHIKVSNYVGVIETRDGTTVEILPKIYSGDDDSTHSVAQTKLVFMRMLGSSSDLPFIQYGQANLTVVEKYPMIEVFVSSYLQDLDDLLRKGIRGGYQSQRVETQFVRGKIMLVEQIRKNLHLRASFYCEYDEFVVDIPPNRLIKSTLMKLQQVSKSSRNRARIIKFLEHFEAIELSQDVDADLYHCSVRSKYLTDYSQLILWSKIFLKNKKFTNFQGDTINQAILFPMEKLFESYIAMLIKRNWDRSSVRIQDKRLFLLAQLNHETGKFLRDLYRLKPDIVLGEGKVILDTKWKVLDERLNNFSIGEDDLYQMNAYGRRYQFEESEGIAPRLGLIYPKSHNFLEGRMHFRYGADMELQVFAFDLMAADQDEEIKRILMNFEFTEISA
jgi:5-methylcytosine-specific restriction enzyme subunit McrC